MRHYGFLICRIQWSDEMQENIGKIRTVWRHTGNRKGEQRGNGGKWKAKGSMTLAAVYRSTGMRHFLLQDHS
jgi:hypothetical protein